MRRGSRRRRLRSSPGMATNFAPYLRLKSLTVVRTTSEYEWPTEGELLLPGDLPVILQHEDHDVRRRDYGGVETTGGETTAGTFCVAFLAASAAVSRSRRSCPLKVPPFKKMSGRGPLAVIAPHT